MHGTAYSDLAKSYSDTSPIALLAPQEGPATSDSKASASVSAQWPAPIRIDSTIQHRNAEAGLSAAASTLLNASAIFGQASRHAV